MGLALPAFPPDGIDGRYGWYPGKWLVKNRGCLIINGRTRNRNTSSYPCTPPKADDISIKYVDQKLQQKYI